MITAITLENFKGISEEATIPLRPLTIMFGKNSAGKSTVVQALHYAREIFERNNLNADRTLLGGASVDLGGFRNLINNHDETKAITMRFDMDLRNAAFPEYDFAAHLEYKRSLLSKGYDEENEPYQYANDLSSLIESAAVELKIEWSNLLARPVITSYKTWINSIEAVMVSTSLDEKNVNVHFNNEHTLLLSTNNFPIPEESGEIEWYPIEVYWYETTLPEKARPLVMVQGEVDEVGIIDDLSLTQMLVAPTDLLREWLSDFRYLGPLRATPPRNFQPAFTQEESDWSNGLAAWTKLYEEGFSDDYVNDWLGAWLNTGFILKLKQFREIPIDSSLMIALTKNSVFDDIENTAVEVLNYPIQTKLVLIEQKSGLEVFPHDVGVGISQVIPVIVIAESSEKRIVAIEQPELHLHPAVQAELGDLFVETANLNQNTFLIETHSEHLILRVLRRIRETTAGKNLPRVPITPEDVSLIYVGESNKQTTFLSLRIDKNGRIVDRVPGGFFEDDFAEIF